MQPDTPFQPETQADEARQPATHQPTLATQPLMLAYAVDATNVGCLVRIVGERACRLARYSEAIQSHGVVIRTGHLVVVTPDKAPSAETPLVIVWRAGTIGSIERITNGKLSLNLGYRTVEMPYRDERPQAEQAVAIEVGEQVLLRGSPIERAVVTDTLRDGELSHPERILTRIRKRLGR